MWDHTLEQFHPIGIYAPVYTRHAHTQTLDCCSETTNFILVNGYVSALFER